MRDSTKKPESSRGRGRPRAFDPDTALGAAAERFRASGYSGTSLDELAAATRLNRPSLYSAFGDKKALYLAALERTYARAERGFVRLGEADLPLRAMLERLFNAVIDGYLTGENGPAGCLFISTAATESVGDPEVRAAIARFLAMEDAQVERLLRNAGAAAPETQARFVTAMIHSLSVRARARAPRAELDALAQDCIDLIAPAA
ncbi:TetR/AcrR family transcriptional regulator [Sphingomonas sp. BT-65]|uniref:TetR/AcrR family transcriptional regulator n=1 Tax=Sphingomonas sp. BT-65 TaxID=2989821 RepID=UPI002236A3FB|nr:TetR/AcrR family transcriptional regulator [Sphingomonas sp. BT-65]MCW4462201.1 TetR/AcrR family transcriptional regulator [Sphingomonas sp. BT-65]